jgi:hypothetical protein
VQGLALPESLVADYQGRGVFAVLGAVVFRGSAHESRLLARAHPSGRWIEWLAARGLGPGQSSGVSGRSMIRSQDPSRWRWQT